MSAQPSTDVKPSISSASTAAAALDKPQSSSGSAAPVVRPASPVLSVLAGSPTLADAQGASSSKAIKHEKGGPPTALVPVGRPKGPPATYVLDDTASKGIGGSQRVWAGWKKDANGQTKAALKKASKDVERDKRESKILQALQHQNIVSLLEPHAKIDDTACLAFPYVEHDLAALLERKDKAWEAGLVKLFARQMLSGIDALHKKKGIVHRNIEPTNILIGNDGVLKIGGFGSAKQTVEGYYTTTSRPKIQENAPTRWYKAPELLLGFLKLGTSLDIWAVGCILGEMVRRLPVFPGSSDAGQLRKIWSLCGRPTADNFPGFDQHGGCSGDSDGSALGQPSDVWHVIDEFQEPNILFGRLIDKCLTLDPEARPKADSLLQAAYFSAAPGAKPFGSLTWYDSSHSGGRRAEAKARSTSTSRPHAQPAGATSSSRPASKTTSNLSPPSHPAPATKSPSRTSSIKKEPYDVIVLDDSDDSDNGDDSAAGGPTATTPIRPALESPRPRSASFAGADAPGPSRASDSPSLSRVHPAQPQGAGPPSELLSALGASSADEALAAASALQAKVAVGTKQLLEKQQALAEGECREIDLKRVIAHGETRLRDLQAVVATQAKGIADGEAQVRSLKTSIDMHSKELQGRIGHAQMERTQAQGALDGLRRRHEDLQREHAALQKMDARKVDSIRQASATNAVLQGELALYKGGVSAAKCEVEALTADVAKRTAEVASLTAEVEKRSRDTIDLAAALDEIKTLDGEIQKRNATIYFDKLELTKAQEELSALSAEAYRDGKLKAVEAKSAQMKLALQSEKKVVRELQAELKTHGQALQELTLQHEVAVAQTKERIAEIESKAEVDQAQARKASDTLIKSQHEKIQSIGKELELEKAKSHERDEQLASAKLDRDNSCRAVQDMFKELQFARDRIGRFEEQVQDLPVATAAAAAIPVPGVRVSAETATASPPSKRKYQEASSLPNKRVRGASESEAARAYQASAPTDEDEPSPKNCIIC